jgi:hypothetical protein
MGGDGRPVRDESDSNVVRIGRLDLRGDRARRFLKVAFCAGAALIACVPGAMAFFAYAEGGTSLWAAVAFAVVIPAGVALWLLWPLRSDER